MTEQMTKELTECARGEKVVELFVQLFSKMTQNTDSHDF